MSRKIYSLGLIGLLLLASVGFVVGFFISTKWTQQSPPAAQAISSSVPPGNDKEQDGLGGPVSRVRTEIAKLSLNAGKLIEGPRQLLELTSYARQGQRIENAYYLVPINAQVGAEEYTRDEKGNVSEMTLRGDNNELLRKEVYTYEYDSVGNWVRMIASTLVYEGDKLAQQPTEVTYRNITYYYDQAIEDIAKSNPSKASDSSGGQAVAGDFAALRGAFDGWLAATNARDLEKLVKFYSLKMDVFYRSRNVAQEFVRADRARMFQRFEAIEVSAGAPEITLSGDGRTATMLFNKEYMMSAKGRQRRGKALQQLRWQLTDDGWKIVSELDIKARLRG
jgi:ketosteroid isomerase-like protein